MIESEVALFVVMRVLFLAAFVPMALLLRYMLRLEWNRAGLIAGMVCALSFGVLTLLPMQTHVVKLDMPRPC